MSTYRAELEMKVATTKQALEAYRLECKKLSIKDKGFEQKLRKLNSLRIDYKTALSRRRNYNNKKTFREEVSMPKYQR